MGEEKNLSEKDLISRESEAQFESLPEMTLTTRLILGECQMEIAEILKLGQGSVLELDSMTGLSSSPVPILNPVRVLEFLQFPSDIPPRSDAWLGSFPEGIRTVLRFPWKSDPFQKDFFLPPFLWNLRSNKELAL